MNGLRYFSLESMRKLKEPIEEPVALPSPYGPSQPR
jgi:hypothetical protein